MNEILFILPEIERENTKRAIDKILDKYRMFLLLESDEFMPQITATYSLIPPSTNKEYKSSTEAAAIRKVDLERARERFIRKVEKAVNRLPQNEREIIVSRYMQREESFDYEVYNNIGLSERTYYRLKARAFYNLAFILGLEVYKEEVKK